MAHPPQKPASPAPEAKPSIVAQEPEDDAQLSFVDSAIAVLRDSFLPFPDPAKEAAFVEFSYPNAMLLPQAVIFFFEAIMSGIAYATIPKDQPQVSAGPVRLAATVICLLFMIAALVCHFKGIFNTSRHAEMWWVPTMAIFSFATLGTLIYNGYSLCTLGPFFQPRFNGTALVTASSTTMSAECLRRMIRGNSMTPIGTAVIGAPRVRFTVLMFTCDLLWYFIARWIFGNAVVWGAGDVHRLWWGTFFIVPFLMMREYRQRQNFRARDAVLFKMQQSTAAREAVESIMVNILPAAILPRLLKREAIFDTANASILFSDIAGFTNWSSRRDAPTIVAMLNCMYREVDMDVEVFEIDKITTIGDAYWAACGLPTPRTNHALRLTAFGLRMQKHVATMRRRHVAFNEIKIRVGIASGTVCGGVVGDLTLQYQVFGPVNEHAEHLEQVAPVNSVTVCGTTLEMIKVDVSEMTSDVSGDFLHADGPEPHSFVVTRVPWAPRNDDGDLLSLVATERTVTGSGAHDSFRARGSHISSERGPTPSGTLPDSAKSDKVARRRLLLKRRDSTAVQTTDDANRIAGNDEEEGEEEVQSLTALREHMATRKYKYVFLEFADDELEQAYRARSMTFYASPICVGVSSAISVTMYFVYLMYMAAELPEQPHHPAAIAIYVVLMIVALLNAIFCTKISPWISWSRIIVDFVAAWCVVTLLMNRRNPLSSLSVDPFYIDVTFVFQYVFTGAPAALNWVFASLICIVPGVSFDHIFYKIRGLAFPITTSAINLFGFGGTLLVGLRNKEVASRNQFLDEQVTIVANRRLEEEKAELELLLGRTVPKFILPELVDWLATDRNRTISHTVPTASILFLRVPAIAHELGLPDADARSQLDKVKQLVALYDQNIECTHKVSSLAKQAILTKIKTIGDIILVAAGLHRYQVAPRGPAAGDQQGTQRASQRAIASQRSRGPSPRGVPRGDYTPMLQTSPDESAHDLLHLALAAKRMERAVYDVFQQPVIAGIHMGPVVCGVLGVERLVFDCFGDTCNTASRIMSTSKVASGSTGVWLSATAFEALSRIGAVSDGASPMSHLLNIEAGGEKREMKGKGSATVFRITSTTCCCPEGAGAVEKLPSLTQAV